MQNRLVTSAVVLVCIGAAILAQVFAPGVLGWVLSTGGILVAWLLRPPGGDPPAPPGGPPKLALVALAVALGLMSCRPPMSPSAPVEAAAYAVRAVTEICTETVKGLDQVGDLEGALSLGKACLDGVTVAEAGVKAAASALDMGQDPACGLKDTAEALYPLTLRLDLPRPIIETIRVISVAGFGCTR